MQYSQYSLYSFVFEIKDGRSNFCCPVYLICAGFIYFYVHRCIVIKYHKNPQLLINFNHIIRMPIDVDHPAGTLYGRRHMSSSAGCIYYAWFVTRVLDQPSVWPTVPTRSNASTRSIDFILFVTIYFQYADFNHIPWKNDLMLHNFRLNTCFV